MTFVRVSKPRVKRTININISPREPEAKRGRRITEITIATAPPLPSSFSNFLSFRSRAVTCICGFDESYPYLCAEFQNRIVRAHLCVCVCNKASYRVFFCRFERSWTYTWNRGTSGVQEATCQALNLNCRFLQRRLSPIMPRDAGIFQLSFYLLIV